MVVLVVVQVVQSRRGLDRRVGRGKRRSGRCAKRRLGKGRDRGVSKLRRRATAGAATVSGRGAAGSRRTREARRARRAGRGGRRAREQLALDRVRARSIRVEGGQQAARGRTAAADVAAANTRARARASSGEGRRSAAVRRTDQRIRGADDADADAAGNWTKTVRAAQRPRGRLAAASAATTAAAVRRLRGRTVRERRTRAHVSRRKRTLKFAAKLVSVVVAAAAESATGAIAGTTTRPVALTASQVSLRLDLVVHAMG